MSFPRYPKYRDSGVEWLGDLPTTWEVSRLGFETWVRARLGWKGLKAEEYVEDGFAFLSTPNIKGRDIDFANVNYITEERFDESPEIKISVGDVLLAKDGSTLGTVNVVRNLPRPTTVNSSIAVISPKQSVDGLFLCYLFASSYMEHTIQRVKGGMGVPHLFQSDLNKFYLPLPPLPEQTAIASFLDRETAKIDELVAEQRRLMELLKEKRQAVISHAVTKGLNPDAPMKPSGIEWLGDVPEHWTTKFLKYDLDLVTSGARGWAQYFSDEGELFFRITNIQRVHLEPDLSECQHVAPPTGAEGERSRIQLGDILISITADLGSVTVAPDSLIGAYVSQHVCLARPGQKLCSKWLGYALKSDCSKMQFEASGYGGTKLQLSLGDVRNIQISLPPLPEQAAIASFLDRETAKVDDLIAEARRAIDLLQERRTALISAAVTGQVDVRGLSEAKSEAA